ncbi:MAG: hypothetical protein WEC75_08745 [Dehalococcoidia bacterium]
MDIAALTSLLFVATFRDWVIIFMGIAVAAFFVVALVITLVLGLLLRSLLRKVTVLLDENMKPLLDSMKETTDQVKGTASYVSKAAVTPIVRTYGVVAGVRRAAGVLTGLTGAGGDKPKE